MQIRNRMNKLKKLERKNRKYKHIIQNWNIGIQPSNIPTMYLAICNAGQVSGLNIEKITEFFHKFGPIENILLIPDKSYCFLSFSNVESAIQALETYNGALNIAQDNKPIYLSYINSLPSFQTDEMCKLPPDLQILTDFITIDEETKLLQFCDQFTAINSDRIMKNRTVQHFGYEFLYGSNTVDKDHPLSTKIPDDFTFLWKHLKTRYNRIFEPDQLTINYYRPGQGIPSHIDSHNTFEDPIISLSIGSDVIMDFKYDESECRKVLLPRRSMTIMTGDSRYLWSHGITPRKYDFFHGNGFERGTRISFTFRQIRRGTCNCPHPQFCDNLENGNTQLGGTDPLSGQELVEFLEGTHVRDVYERIAGHFSDTRHTPWPNIVDFIQNLKIGSVLVDMGCGNGKYLGLRPHKIFCLGLDNCMGLCEVCRSKNFEIFLGNCLMSNLKDEFADAVLSIAVIHHFATEERRLLAIREIVRILKINGQALIYVWAKDQAKNNTKSSYLKSNTCQNHAKNQSNLIGIDTATTNEMYNVGNSTTTLPIHTNRTQFVHNDLLVPWKLRKKQSSDMENDIFLRFYHVFNDSELLALCERLSNVIILKHYYDQGNWCVLLKKTN